MLAGIFSIIIGMGVARFAFTSLLPPMLADYLSLTQVGVLASLNFAGYLAGALFSISLKNIQTKIFFFRLGLFISITSSFVLATSHNELLWLISRTLAGFGSAMTFLVGSSIVMLKLNLENKTKAMGVYFSGIGLGIVSSELLTQGILLKSSWESAWLWLSLVALLLSLYAYYILSFEKTPHSKEHKPKIDFSIFTPYVILLVLAYFTEGVGFVIQGTFLPNIINSLEGLEGFGNLGWLIVGVTGIPSSIFWMHLAHKYDNVNVIIAAMALQMLGVLIPTFTANIYANLLAAALYGSTFIGLVALFMNLGGQISQKNPVTLMGAMTAAYGIGQVTAPLYSVALIAHFGNYNTTLYLTAFILFIGILLLRKAKTLA